MRKVFAFLLMVAPIMTFGQLSPDENYVHTVSYTVPVQDGNQHLVADSDKQETVTYYDGMARPMQSIALYQGGKNESVVMHYEYDAIGRQSKSYLPYAIGAEVTNHLEMANDAQAKTFAFYNTTKYENTTNPYAETKFDQSSLGRPIEMAAQGNDWKIGSSHTVKMDYKTNGLNEVKQFHVEYTDTALEQTQLIFDGYYVPSELYKVIVKDENWGPDPDPEVINKDHTTEEFKDKLGRVILKRTYNENIPHDTYYVYDDFGNLTYVIPPKASDEIVLFGEQDLKVASQRNYPWVDLVNVDKAFADSYNNQLSSYDNEDILNADVTNAYDGQGGFTVTTLDDDDTVTLSISFSANQAFSLKNGDLVSLNDYGTYKDTELGRLQGTGYDYLFQIKNNNINISGTGSIAAISETFTSNLKLDYSENYPWTDYMQVDPLFAKDYESQLATYPNSDILTVNIPNTYNGQGGLNIMVDAYDVITLNLNSYANTAFRLNEGIIFPLNIARRMADRDLGTISGTGYEYHFSIVANSLYIEGSGLVTGGLTAFFSAPAPPPTSVSPEGVAGLCYMYHYDKRNRMVEFVTPGKGWEHVVYDKLNRPILTQDAKQRIAKEWLYVKYDRFGRVVYTGTYTYHPTGTDDNSGRLELQALVDNQTSPVWFETKQTTNSNLGIKYSNDAFPNDAANMQVYTINFYDNYDGFNIPEIILLPGTTVFGQAITSNTKSLATASKVRVLGTNDWISYVTYYDDKARPIFAASKNEYLSTIDQVKNELDFAGRVLQSSKTHTKDTNTPIIIHESYTYDHAGRLLTQVQTIDANTPELIVNNHYDELGRLEAKKVGGVVSNDPTSSDGLQQVDYAFNIRGWLKSINEGNTNNGDIFGFKLNYNNTELTGAKALFNGNISESHFVSASDNKIRSYDYQYDALNRLTKANYHGNYTVEGLGVTEDYSLKEVTYDKNGNITSLKRLGLYGIASGGPQGIDLIDQLSYFYAPLSNQLSSVNDVATTDGFKDGNTSGNDFVYDINGNLTEDKNKGITKITYNYLDLPTKVVFHNDDVANPEAGVIEYVYDATGTKLKKSTKFSSLSSAASTYYAGNMVYEQSSSLGSVDLKFIGNSEGYAQPKSTGGYDYIYQYRDHLGNVRVAYELDEDNSIIIDEDYSSGTYDWSSSGNVLINNTNEQLNVSITNKWGSTSKYVSFTPGEPIHIEFDFDKGTMDKPILFVREQINGVWEPNLDRDRIVLNESGHYELDLTLQGDMVRIYFEKGTAGDNGTLTTCHVDNLIITQNILEIVQSTNYYPFGMDHNYGINSPMSVINGTYHKFKYNGQEEDKSFGLNVTEMTFRQFDMALGRFHGIDKLAAYDHSLTPYHFGANNPVYYSDPSGLKVAPPDTFNYAAYYEAVSWNPRLESHWSDAFNGGFYSGGGGGGLASVFSSPTVGLGGSMSDALAGMIALTNASDAGSVLFSNDGSGYFVSENDGAVSYWGNTFSGEDWAAFGEFTQLDEVTVNYGGNHSGAASQIASNIEDTRWYNDVFNKSLTVMETAAYASLSLAMNSYESSLSIMDDVGMKNSAALIRSSSSVLKWVGRAGYVAGAASLYLSTDAVINGSISGLTYAWDVSSVVVPTAAGILATSAGPGLLVGSFYMAVDAGREVINVIENNFTFDFGNSYNIQYGFSMFR